MHAFALIDEEDGAFGVTFPDFPGCTTVAGDLDQAVAKAAEVLAFHVEGMVADGLALPPVRSFGELRRDPAFRAESKRAIVVVPVPFAPPARAVRVNITVDENLLERIDRAAAAAGETRSGYLAAAARQRLRADTMQDNFPPVAADAAHTRKS